MSVTKFLKSLSDEELVDICDTYHSANGYLRSIKASSGRNTVILTSLVNNLNLEWKPFKSKAEEKRVCPVCDTIFKVGGMTGRKKKQVTCSKSCSNTHFKTGRDNPNYIPDSPNTYRYICFEHHKKECIVCGENNVVAVHHYDENHNNNDPENLVPLCPNHHHYVHSNKYKHLVQDSIDNYVIEFKKRL